jgi:hypothetical protein
MEASAGCHREPLKSFDSYGFVKENKINLPDQGLFSSIYLDLIAQNT